MYAHNYTALIRQYLNSLAAAAAPPSRDHDAREAVLARLRYAPLQLLHHAQLALRERVTQGCGILAL